MRPNLYIYIYIYIYINHIHEERIYEQNQCKRIKYEYLWNMPPGAPTISFFTRCLYYWKTVCIARAESIHKLKPLDSICWFSCMHCFMSDVLRRLLFGLTWIREPGFWDCWLSLCTTFWLTESAFRGIRTCHETVSKIVEKRSESDISSVNVNSHLLVRKSSFWERSYPFSKTFKSVESRGGMSEAPPVHDNMKCSEIYRNAPKCAEIWWKCVRSTACPWQLKCSEIYRNAPKCAEICWKASWIWPELQGYLPPEIQRNPMTNRSA